MIILAAGRGERLFPLTKNTPKPLLDMGNGNTLLEEQLSRIAEAGVIDEVVIVVGYLAEQVEAKVATHQAKNLLVRTLFNPFYDVSNNLMSLWFARSAMDSDFMVTNGDNLFSAHVFRDFADETGDGIWLAVSRKAAFDHDDMKVSLQDEQIIRVSKQIEDPDAHAESPGLSLVRGERARRVYLDQLEKLGRDRQYMNGFWLECYNAAYNAGVTIKPWWFESEGAWQEVDFHQDVDQVRSALQLRVKPD